MKELNAKSGLCPEEGHTDRALRAFRREVNARASTIQHDRCCFEASCPLDFEEINQVLHLLSINMPFLG